MTWPADYFSPPKTIPHGLSKPKVNRDLNFTLVTLISFILASNYKTCTSKNTFNSSLYQGWSSVTPINKASRNFILLHEIQLLKYQILKHPSIYLLELKFKRSGSFS